MKYKKYPKELINSINNKKYIELSKDNKIFIKQIFKDINDNDIIEINKVYTSNKTLLEMIVNNKKIYVNVLFKTCELLYEDSVFSFVSFLKKLKLDSKFINDFYYCFWADYTYNNTGKKRISFKEFSELFPSIIKKINYKFNETQNLIQLIDLCLFHDKSLPTRVSYLLYFKNNRWNVHSREEVKSILSLKKNENTNGIYIGPFAFQNKKRNIEFIDKYEYKRSYVVIKWYNYQSDI